MTTIDIVQLALVIIPIIIETTSLWFSIKEFKENRKKEGKQKAKQLQRDSNIFVQENSDEIDYLPLCIIANAVSPYAHNERKIYNSFNSSPKEVQLEILKMKRIPIGLIKDKKVLDECIRSFDDQSHKHNLSSGSLLHDNAKYLHAAIKYYKGMKLPSDINPSVFETPNKNVIFAFKPNQTFDLANYIVDYLDSNENSSKNETMKSPFDIIEEKYDIEGLGDPRGCFWIMRFILSSCVAFWRSGKVKNSKEEWRQWGVDNDEIIKTYEDMYYDTLLMLFSTYGSLEDTEIGKQSIYSKSSKNNE